MKSFKTEYDQEVKQLFEFITLDSDKELVLYSF